MVNRLLAEIEKLDWDCHEAETQYLSHSIHRYSGKFIPQIARQAIELLTKPGDLVLDPFCGSGTTLLECTLTGRRAIGLDLNTLAVLISRVKTSSISQPIIKEFFNRLYDRISPLLNMESTPRLFDSHPARTEEMLEEAYSDPRWTHPWYAKWFDKDIRAQLIAIHNQISRERNIACKQVGLIAFSDILRKSSNAHGSYPNVMFYKSKERPPLPCPAFVKRLEQILESISATTGAINGNPKPVVLRGDARSFPLKTESVDSIITHPPYIGSVPYAEYGALSLMWFGIEPAELDRKLIGGMRQTKDVVQRYEEGFTAMIGESLRVLRSKGYMFMLLGNPTVQGTTVDLGLMAKEIAAEKGFALAAEHYRKGNNRRANLMSEEVLLFFLKKKSFSSRGSRSKLKPSWPKHEKTFGKGGSLK